jgi:hypothetical protein
MLKVTFTKESKKTVVVSIQLMLSLLVRCKVITLSGNALYSEKFYFFCLNLKLIFFLGNKDFNSNQDEDGNYDWILDETPRGKTH